MIKTKAALIIVSGLWLSGCSTAYKLPEGDDLALLKLDMPVSVLQRLNFYHYRQPKGNMVDVFLYDQENKPKPSMFLITANRKVRLSFTYNISFADYCEQYIEFYPRANEVYTITLKVRDSLYQDYFFTTQHDCDFMITDEHAQVRPTYKHPNDEYERWFNKTYHNGEGNNNNKWTTITKNKPLENRYVNNKKDVISRNRLICN